VSREDYHDDMIFCPGGNTIYSLGTPKQFPENQPDPGSRDAASIHLNVYNVNIKFTARSRTPSGIQNQFAVFDIEAGQFIEEIHAKQ